MHHITRRLSPSLILAITALFVALAGTAYAVDEIITDPSQVAKGVITGAHLKNEDISNLDLKDPQLKLRVAADGTHIGAGDGSAVRFSTGEYAVTFDDGVLNGLTGETTDTVLSENCAITATARDGGRVLTSLRTVGAAQPNTVQVSTSLLYPLASL